MFTKSNHINQNQGLKEAINCVTNTLKIEVVVQICCVVSEIVIDEINLLSLSSENSLKMVLELITWLGFIIPSKHIGYLISCALDCTLESNFEVLQKNFIKSMGIFGTLTSVIMAVWIPYPIQEGTISILKNLVPNSKHYMQYRLLYSHFLGIGSC